MKSDVDHLPIVQQAELERVQRVLMAEFASAIGRATTASRRDGKILKIILFGSYRPTDPQIAWHLARFIENVRSITLDPVLMRRDWLSAYDFATQRGGVFLGEYARAADPFAHIGEKTVSVQVTSVVRASDQSFQLKWTETSFDRGAQSGITRWTGILTVKLKPPATADALRKNPLGVYVDAIDWSRELDGPQPVPNPPASAMTPPPAVSSTLPLGSPLNPTLGTTPTKPASENQQ